MNLPKSATCSNHEPVQNSGLSERGTSVSFPAEYSGGVARGAIHINDGKRSVGLNPNGVDHQSIAHVVAHGIPIPGWRHVCWMSLVHAYVADRVILVIKDRDLARLLEHLHSEIPKNVWDGFGPTLVARDRSGDAAQLDLALLPHGLCRPWFQDRIGIIAHKLAAVAYEEVAIAPTSKAPD